MSRNVFRATVVGLSSVFALLAILQSANSAIIDSQRKYCDLADLHRIQAQNCWRKIGPFGSQYLAEQARQVWQSRGYNTSPVFGEGGLYSGWQNRQYFFTVFFRC